MKKNLLLILFILAPFLLIAAKVTMDNGTVINCVGDAATVAKQINGCKENLCCCDVQITDIDATIPWESEKACFNPQKVSTVTLETPPDVGGNGRNPLFVALALVAIALAIFFKRN